MRHKNIEKHFTGVGLEYFTGLFDGEGCLFTNIVKHRNGKTINITFKLIISNTNLEVLKWCKSTLGCGHIVEAKNTDEYKKSKKFKRTKTCWRYVIDQRSVLIELFEYMLPLSIIKKSQIEQALIFLKSRSEKPNNYPYSEKEIRSTFNCKSLLQCDDGFATFKKIKYSFDTFKKIFDLPELCPFEWTNKSDVLLGTDTDTNIARKLNIHRQQVLRRRLKLKINPFYSYRTDLQ